MSERADRQRYDDYDFVSYNSAYEAARDGKVDLNNFTAGAGITAAQDAIQDVLDLSNRINTHCAVAIIERRPQIAPDRPRSIIRERRAKSPLPLTLGILGVGTAAAVVTSLVTQDKAPEVTDPPFNETCSSPAHDMSIPQGKVKVRKTTGGTQMIVTESTSSDEPIRVRGNIQLKIPEGTHVYTASVCSDISADSPPSITLEEGASARFLNVQAPQGRIIIRPGSIFQSASTNGQGSRIYVPRAESQPDRLLVIGSDSKIMPTDD